jgi:hypothetical protein
MINFIFPQKAKVVPLSPTSQQQQSLLAFATKHSITTKVLLAKGINFSFGRNIINLKTLIGGLS